MEFLKRVVKDIGDFLVKLFLTLLVKNPCKKCLVRACCLTICEKREYYLSFCDIEGKIVFQRFCAIGIIFSCVSIGFSLSHHMLK